MSISLFAQGKNLILKTVKYSKEQKLAFFYCLDETEIDKPAYGCSGDMKGRDLFHPSVFFVKYFEISLKFVKGLVRPKKKIYNSKFTI